MDLDAALVMVELVAWGLVPFVAALSLPLVALAAVRRPEVVIWLAAAAVAVLASRALSFVLVFFEILTLGLPVVPVLRAWALGIADGLAIAALLVAVARTLR